MAAVIAAHKALQSLETIVGRKVS